MIMATAPVDKVIVTNGLAMKAKYGAKYASRIKPAIDALIKADKARGMLTRLVLLDSATGMHKLKATPVTNPASPKQNKQAIDGVFDALQPAYLCILGSVDIVPHQALVNPLASDGDPLAPSDLPYACGAGYSKQIDHFLQPTRVVGRLPDVTGATGPDYLTGLLKTAAAAQSLPVTAFAKYLGISAKVWKASTQQSLQNTFGNGTDMKIVPPSSPPWPQIARHAHFVNCHGASADPQFYGQQGNSFPVAHAAAKLAGLSAGTVASVECCYGAELYDPALANGQAGICNTYLAKGAHGYFGSSTIAYGPASGNGQADLICQFFLKHVLTGASTGEATLRARLDFIQLLSVAEPTDLKTLAQFNLMGDPSLHPVQTAMHAGDAIVKSGPAKSAGATKAKARSDPALLRAASRPQRRAHLAALGRVLGSAVASVDSENRRASTGNIKSLLEAELRQQGAARLEVCSFGVKPPPASAAGRSGAKAKAAAPSLGRVDVAVGELPQRNAPFRRLLVVVARRVGNAIIIRHLYSR
jgi:hypothetical protein